MRAPGSAPGKRRAAAGARATLRGGVILQDEDCAALFAVWMYSPRVARRGYSELAPNVSHCLMLPLSRPRLNQRTRWAEEPWVKESGTT